MCLKSCCFCHSLRRGALCIGLLFMVGSAVVLLMEVGLLAEWADVRTRMANERMREFSRPAIVVALVMTFLYLIFSMVLLKGVKEERRFFLLPWLVWSIVHILLVVAANIYHFSTSGQEVGERVAAAVIYVTIWMFWTYAVLCVASYYVELASKAAENDGKTDADSETIELPLVRLESSKRQRIYPHSLWEDSSAGDDLDDDDLYNGRMGRSISRRPPPPPLPSRRGETIRSSRPTAKVHGKQEHSKSSMSSVSFSDESVKREKKKRKRVKVKDEQREDDGLARQTSIWEGTPQL